MREIQARAKSIRELLKDQKYGIDYYQREYKWETKQIRELVTDLVEAFLDSYSDKHERPEIKKYNRYFLGSIILSERDQDTFIVDGQQRLSSLTLLLIYLRNLQREHSVKVKIDELILSEIYGVRSFNLNIPERVRCLEVLFEDKPFDPTDEPESVQTLVNRYDDIGKYFPIIRSEDAEDNQNSDEDDLGSALPWRSLPFFIDWLTENVHLVEITAYSDDDAYTIFETMNDRGLSLTPTDMLKGYLLANITQESKRIEANNRWKSRIASLEEYGKESSSDFLKAWLRSQYANKIRERKKDAKPEEWDRIGTEFHRWLRDNDERAGLTGSEGFHRFVVRDMDFYGRQYERILQASVSLVPGLERICYLATLGFTLHPMVLLAPLDPADEESVIIDKLQAVATFLDILLVWRQWNYRTISYSGMQYAMFNVMVAARKERDPKALRQRLFDMLLKEEETFDSSGDLRLHQRNSWFIRTFLARITDYVETSAGNPSHFLEFMDTKAKNRYEIEHIWADKFEEHEDEFSHPNDFAEFRNRVGDLLLLPKKFNASYSAKPYRVKRPHYFGQNLLARSLDAQAYEMDPGFRTFVNTSQLPFRAHETFLKADIQERQELYRQIAKRIWNPALLLLEPQV